MRRTLAILLALCISIGASAQGKMVLVYAMGEAGNHTPFCQLSSNGKRFGTVKLGEYVIIEVPSTRPVLLDINRGGIEKETVILELGTLPQFVKVVLSHKGLDAWVDPTPPNAIATLLPIESEASIPDVVASRIHHSRKGWPPFGSNVQLKFECPEDHQPSATAEGIIISGLSKTYTVVNRENLVDILNEQRIALSGMASDSASIHAGELLSSAWTIVVKYTLESTISGRFIAINNQTGQQQVPLILDALPTQYFKSAMELSLTGH